MTLTAKILAKGIEDFHFGNCCGFDVVDETKTDSGANEWMKDLSIHLEQTLADYIDGKVSV